MGIADLTDEQFKIWLAGFFDADGCVRASSSNRNSYELSISQAIPNALFEIKRRYGGGISYSKPNPQAGQVKCWYKWNLGKYDSVVRFLSDIHENLVCKKEQAQMILNHMTRAEPRSMTIEEYDNFNRTIKEMKTHQRKLTNLTPEEFEAVSNRRKEEYRNEGW